MKKMKKGRTKFLSAAFATAMLLGGCSESSTGSQEELSSSSQIEESSSSSQEELSSSSEVSSSSESEISSSSSESEVSSSSSEEVSSSSSEEQSSSSSEPEISSSSTEQESSSSSESVSSSSSEAVSSSSSEEQSSSSSADIWAKIENNTLICGNYGPAEEDYPYYRDTLETGLNAYFLRDDQGKTLSLELSSGDIMYVGMNLGTVAVVENCGSTEVGVYAGNGKPNKFSEFCEELFIGVPPQKHCPNYVPSEEIER
ncbi:hypothetical protein AGMMS49938_02750 [Fibrobacterales bacterium]|nr:hypothetical protein AGMMS49938_02750 [Fibrobacterales bacterium]